MSCTNQKPCFRVKILFYHYSGWPTSDLLIVSTLHLFFDLIKWGPSKGNSLSIKGLVPNPQSCKLKKESPQSTCFNPIPRRVPGMCHTRVNKYPTELCQSPRWIIINLIKVNIVISMMQKVRSIHLALSANSISSWSIPAPYLNLNQLPIKVYPVWVKL